MNILRLANNSAPIPSSRWWPPSLKRKAGLRRDFHAAVGREGFLIRERFCDAHRLGSIAYIPSEAKKWDPNCPYQPSQV